MIREIYTRGIYAELWEKIRILYFETDSSFLKYMEPFLLRSRNWKALIEHEMEHAKKARELGYKVTYSLIVGKSRDWGWDVILDASVAPIGEIFLEDLIKINSAPRITSYVDRKNINLCKEKMEEGKRKGFGEIKGGIWKFEYLD